MIAVEVAVGARAARLWFDIVPTPEQVEAARQALLSLPLDENELALETLLRQRLRHPVVEATAHPGIEPDEVCQVFLGGDAPLFACTVVSRGRMATMLREGAPVLEGSSLQVTTGLHLTGDGLRAAMEAWMERNFPDLPLARFRVGPWVDPDEIRVELIDTAGLRVTATVDPKALPEEAAMPEAA